MSKLITLLATWRIGLCFVVEIATMVFHNIGSVVSVRNNDVCFVSVERGFVMGL